MDTPIVVPTKRCGKCKQLLPKTTEYFYLRSGGKYLRSECITCTRNANDEWKRDNREAHRAHGRKAYRTAIAKDSDYNRKREARRDPVKQYAKMVRYETRNRERRRAMMRQWSIENADYRAEYHRNYRARLDVIERSRQWRIDNRERIQEQTRLRRASHPEVFRVSKHRRRAREANAQGTHTAQDLRILIEESRNRCWWCGKKIKGKFHVDHRVPLARGGSNDITNLCVSCPKCNHSKGAKLPQEWSGRLL